MSVDQLPTRQPPRRSNEAQLVRCEDYIEAKIQSTRRAVKAVDLSTALVTLVASVLGYLLVVAVVEHWIMPGGFNVPERLVLFGILIVGMGYFVYKRLWPSLVHAINPVYAAKAIEEHSPSLKNSLINLLFFRERRAGISEAVYRTLEEQAAQGLTRVPLETSVDRSILIRLGYVLVGVVAIAGLYKVLSPKDPLISAERILLPWADIVPSSRVTISAVTPGSVTVSRGEFVDVSAEVHGLGDDDAMVLRYTTADSQVVGRAIPMKPAGDGLNYVCRVSDEAEGSEPTGLTRSLKYRLEAGDARSLAYSIEVVSAPSILVEHVDYHYPPYTGYVDRTVEGLGDIRAIEGTRITIHARANGQIRNAEVDFDADGRTDLRMTTKETSAVASFELGLREGREIPLHASYVLRFANDEGRTNRDPVKHSIAVDRDQDPEAAVLLPREKAIDARLDETVFIEVEASDPDFKLSAVRLHGEVSGQAALNEELLKGEHKGRFTTRYSFVPKDHGLKPGDIVQYWVEADDNRTPKPNTVATKKDNRTIRIISPNPGQQPPPNQVARNDRQQPKQGGEQQNGQQQQGDQQQGQNQGQKNQGGSADQKDNANQQQGGESDGKQQSGEKQGQQNGENKQGGGEGNQNGQQNSDNQQQSKGDPKSGGEGQGENAQGGEQKGREQKPGQNAKGGSQSKSGDGSNDQQQNKGEQTGAGASGGQSSKDAARPDGARPDEKQEGEKGRGGEGEKSKQQNKSGEQQPAVSSEGDNDGEAFERIQKRMEQNGELKKDEPFSRDAQRSAEQKQEDAKQQEEKSQQEPGKDKSQGESKSGDGKSANDQSASANEKSGEKSGDANQKQSSDGQGQDQNKSAGAKPNGDDAQQKKEQQSGDGGEQKKSPEGQETGSKGPAGAGEQKQNQGAPNSQEQKKPTEKHQQSGSKESTDKQDPSAGARGKKESDSSGDQGGDKSGGGEEGAGQKAPREGTGSAGDHQSADNGTGQSAEKGQGDKSSSGGKDAKSDHKTGSSDGKTPGEGSQQKDGSGKSADGQFNRDAQRSAEERQGDKETERQGDKEVGKQSDQKSGEAGKKNEGSEQGKSGGPSEGGGVPGDGNSGPTIKGSAPEGDAANLEYARKQTDLVLEKLSDQLNKNKVDDRMLKELGWTRDDLRRFVERWQQRKDAAQRDDQKGEAAKRELDDALRSLGLQRDKLQQNVVQKDTMRDLKHGYRGAVPLEYQERMRAYNQGVSRAARDGE